jgi:periplasmic protein TonB
MMMANETTRFAEPPATARRPNPIAHFGLEPSDDAPLTPVLILVVWVVCLAVGLLGLMLPYARPHQFVKVPQPVKIEKLVVELKSTPPAPIQTERLPAPGSFVPLPADAMAPPPIPVAQPSAAIAFAVPVEGPTRVVPFDQAAYAKPSQTASPTAQGLGFGQGEGKQPSPFYPAQAIQQHQEGTVVVRLKVAESGQVSSAEATQPSPWPLLNQSALRTVRQQWRFPAGDERVYEVAIRFQITTP